MSGAMPGESLRDRLIAAHQGLVGEMRTQPDGYGSFVHFGPEEMADRIAGVVAEWLRAEAASAHAEGVRAGWEQAVKALNDQNRFMRWQIEHLLEHPDDRRLSCELHADYLASLTPTTEEADDAG